MLDLLGTSLVVQFHRFACAAWGSLWRDRDQSRSTGRRRVMSITYDSKCLKHPIPTGEINSKCGVNAAVQMADSTCSSQLSGLTVDLTLNETPFAVAV
eukprot:2217961-Amphidinium_carterae.1